MGRRSWRQPSPLQVRIGAKGGTEILTHALRRCTHMHIGPGSLHAEMENAFNSISWAAIVAAVQARAPVFLQVVQCAYCEALSLLVVRAEGR